MISNIEITENELQNSIEITEIEKSDKNEKSEKEPMPETLQEDTQENPLELTFDEISKKIKLKHSLISKLMKEIQQDQKDLDRSFKKNKNKNKKNNKKNNLDSVRKPSGFDIPVTIPSLFYEFIKNGLETDGFTETRYNTLLELQITEDSKITRAFITGTVYDYIRHKNLYVEPEELKKMIPLIIQKLTKAEEEELNEDLKEKIIREKNQFNKVNLDLTQTNRRYTLMDINLRKLFIAEEDEILTFFNFQKYVTRLFPKQEILNTNDNEDKLSNEELEEVDDETEITVSSNSDNTTINSNA